MVASKHPFRFLLVALVLFLVLPPILRYVGFPEGGKLGSFLLSALFIVLLLSALPAVGSTRGRLIAACIVAGLLIVLVMLHTFTEVQGPGLAIQVLMALFLFYVSPRSIASVFGPGPESTRRSFRCDAWMIGDGNHGRNRGALYGPWSQPSISPVSHTTRPPTRRIR